MQKKTTYFIVIAIILFFFSSCGISKYVPKEDYLLKKNKFEVKSEEKGTDKTFFNLIPVKVDEFEKAEAATLAEQKTNSKILGIRTEMRIYCLSNPQKDNWLNRTLRKQGEPPVIFDYDKAELSAQKMEQYLNTKGIFNPKVTFGTIPAGKKKVKVKYTIYASKRYKIKDITYLSENEDISRELEQWKRRSILKPEAYYDQSMLSNERDNLVTYLRNRGYYAFNRDFVSFVVDTTVGNHYLNIELKVSPQAYEDSLSNELAFSKFYLNDLHVYIGNSSADFQKQNLDTLKLTLERKSVKKENQYTFIYADEDRKPIKPRTIDQHLFFDRGDFFQLRRLEQSYIGLADLQNFKSIDISFRQTMPPFDSLGNRRLDAFVHLLNAKRHSFSTAMEINNTPSTNVDKNVGNFGLEWNLTYRNKNLFNGAEIFEIKTKLAVELYRDVLDKELKTMGDYFSNFESGIDMGLEIPQFLLPYGNRLFSRDFRPKTTINTGYNYQKRSVFDRYIINAGYGYRWRNNIRNIHQLLPIEFNIVRINIESENFQLQLDTMKDARIKYQYSSHFIMDMRYNYTYNGQISQRHRDFTYFSLSAESAGNLLYAIDKTTNSKVHESENGDKFYHKFGVPYSQYLRGTFDLKRYTAITSTSSFVARIYGGIGAPYGNAISLPYEKSFYGGGPTTIRAWRMRDLGPGNYNLNSGNTFDKIGDISLVSNLEMRFPLAAIFEGALFVDAGNVWLLKESEEFPGGKFEWNKFYKDIAMGGGFGIRMNIYITTIRFDFAMPFRDPSREDNRWRFDKWKWSDMVVNFGIGYPF